ncbi:MAG: hypothetical protein WA970_12255 [Gammaproteobacteria bacterium]
MVLATGTLNQCVHEAAHAVLPPVEEELVEEVDRLALFAHAASATLINPLISYDAENIREGSMLEY